MTLSGRRLDIQGLRALAVGLVLAAHVLGWPAGGFVGVDVFFVISGFLITGLLLGEVERDGRISLGGFYRRRARRILPAALLVLAVTVTASYVVMLQERFERTAADAGWSAVFLANWRFATSDADYFDAAQPASPLQHYWSLAVEEQFYVLWPLLLLGLLAVLRRRAPRTSGRVDLCTGVAVVAGLVLAGSFAWAWYAAATEPTSAYYSTATRAWELAAGALLAALAPRLTSLPGAARNTLALVGLAAIVASALTLSGSSAFPAPLGAAPVLGAVLLLAAGIGTERVAATWILRTRPLVYLGALSFSLYLWHWPVQVLGEVLAPAQTVEHRLLALGLTLVLAVASYHLVERPVLDSDVGFPGRPGAAQAARRLAVGSLAVAVALVAVVVVVPRDTPGGSAPVAATGADRSGASSPERGRTPRQRAEDVIVGGLVAGLTAAEFPVLEPPLDDVIDQGIAPELEPGAECLNPVSLTDPDLCWHGAGPRRAMVVGDSVAIAWLPTIREALGEQWSVRGYALSNCPYVDAAITIDYDAQGAERCNAARPTIYEQVRRERPDLLVLSSLEVGVLWLGRFPLSNAQQAWRDGAVRAIEEMAAEGTRVAIIGPPPAGHAVAGCVTRFSVPADCQGSPSDAWRAQAAAEREAARAAGATYIDPERWFCLEKQCPIFAGGTVIRWDAVHVTRQYAAALVDVLRVALRPALSPGRSPS